MSEPRQRVSPHPNDGCDEDKCYEVMMTERTVLITARRESEDNLIKTIITLSSSLVVLMAGFATQKSSYLTGWSIWLFSGVILALGGSIVAGLLEQFFSSKAYQEQQTALEDFYGKYIDSFAEAPSNKYVRVAQVTAFAFFVIALCALGVLAIIKIGDVPDVRQPATATATATATAPSATAPSAPSPSATTTTAAGATVRCRRVLRGPNQIGGTKHAPPAAEERELSANGGCTLGGGE